MQQEAGLHSLKQRLTDDMKQALRSGDKVRLSVVRLALAAIKNAEIARGDILEDADTLGIIAKEIRQRRESIGAFKAGKRHDLVAQEEAEIAEKIYSDSGKLGYIIIKNAGILLKVYKGNFNKSTRIQYYNFLEYSTELEKSGFDTVLVFMRLDKDKLKAMAFGEFRYNTGIEDLLKGIIK